MMLVDMQILDQLLGTDGGATATADTLAVVNDCQILLDGDGILRADLLTQAAANTTHGTATGGDSTLCIGCAGDSHNPAGLHRNDQVPGTGIGTGHTAHA